MIDYSTTVVNKLNTILPCYYELFCDSNTQKPCITYMTNSDVQGITGDTLGYSNVRFTIKLWGNDLSVLSPHAISVDAAMRDLGFNRISTNELTADEQICKIFTYECLSREYFNN